MQLHITRLKGTIELSYAGLIPSEYPISATGEFSSSESLCNIMKDWSKMLFAGATSFWETLSGGWDFNHAGSLCHGWSGIPVYFYGAYGLGIKPLEPEFKSLTVKPLLKMARLKGTIPTARGNIKIALDKVKDGYVTNIQAPKSIEIVAAPSKVIECIVSQG